MKSEIIAAEFTHWSKDLLAHGYTEDEVWYITDGLEHVRKKSPDLLNMINQSKLTEILEAVFSELQKVSDKAKQNKEQYTQLHLSTLRYMAQHLFLEHLKGNIKDTEVFN